MQTAADRILLSPCGLALLELTPASERECWGLSIFVDRIAVIRAAPPNSKPAAAEPMVTAFLFHTLRIVFAREFEYLGSYGQPLRGLSGRQCRGIDLHPPRGESKPVKLGALSTIAARTQRTGGYRLRPSGPFPCDSPGLSSVRRTRSTVRSHHTAHRVDNDAATLTSVLTHAACLWRLNRGRITI